MFQVYVREKGLLPGGSSKEEKWTRTDGTFGARMWFQ